MQTIGPATTSGYRYQVSYSNVDESDYRVPTGGGSIDAKLVVVAAGAMATPAILQRSAPLLGGMPKAAGRYFSPNGDHVSMAVLDEKKLHHVLGLQRKPGVAYDAFPIGKPIGSMTYDYLDRSSPDRGSGCSRSTSRRSPTSCRRAMSTASGSGRTRSS